MDGSSLLGTSPAFLRSATERIPIFTPEMSSPVSPESLQALVLECLSSLCKLCSLNSAHDTAITTTPSLGEMHGLMYETSRFRQWTKETKAKEASFVEALRRNKTLNVLIKYSLVKMASIIDPLYRKTPAPVSELFSVR